MNISLFPRNDVRSFFTYSWDQGFYVYYKDECLEHYNSIETDRSIARLKVLADRCRALEFMGVPVNGSTAVWFKEWFEGINHLIGTDVIKLMGMTPSLYEREEETIALNKAEDFIVLKDKSGNVRIFHSLADFAADQGVKVAEFDSVYHTMKSANFKMANCGQREDLGTCYAQGVDVAKWLNARLADKLAEILGLIQDIAAYRKMMDSIREAA